MFVPREPRDRNFHEWRHWSLVVPGVPIGGWPRLVRALSLLCKQWMTGRSQFESLAPAIWVEDIGRFIVLRSDHAHRAAGSEVVEVGCPACTHSHHHPPPSHHHSYRAILFFKCLWARTGVTPLTSLVELTVE